MTELEKNVTPFTHVKGLKHFGRERYINRVKGHAHFMNLYPSPIRALFVSSQVDHASAMIVRTAKHGVCRLTDCRLVPRLVYFH